VGWYLCGSCVRAGKYAHYISFHVTVDSASHYYYCHKLGFLLSVNTTSILYVLRSLLHVSALIVFPLEVNNFLIPCRGIDIIMGIQKYHAEELELL
jgi:hypothetical protein